MALTAGLSSRDRNKIDPRPRACRLRAHELELEPEPGQLSTISNPVEPERKPDRSNLLELPGQPFGMIAWIMDNFTA